MGERDAGSVEVRGSNPLTSTGMEEAHLKEWASLLCRPLLSSSWSARVARLAATMVEAGNVALQEAATGPQHRGKTCQRTERREGYQLPQVASLPSSSLGDRGSMASKAPRLPRGPGVYLLHLTRHSRRARRRVRAWAKPTSALTAALRYSLTSTTERPSFSRRFGQPEFSLRATTT